MEKSSCHPALLLEDVLEVIFNKLPFEELTACRQVCRKWEEASRPLVKSQSELRLSGNIRRNSALGEFLRRDSHFFIPSKLKIDLKKTYMKDIQLWAEDEDSSEPQSVGNYDDRLCKGLEDIYGALEKHSFEELEIYGVDFSNFDRTAGRMLNILGHLSSLKFLKTSLVPGDATPTGQQTLDICPLLTKLSIEKAPEWFLSRIFTACPNLTEISGNGHCNLSILDKCSGRLTKISGFSCSTQEDLEILERKSGNLAELSLEVEESVGESILDFVQSQKGSLALLELNFCKVPLTLRFGQGFSRLTKLHLQLGKYDYSTHYPPRHQEQGILNISFLKDTPQLKYFKLKVFGTVQNWKDLLAYKSNITKCGRVIILGTLTHLDLSESYWKDRECADYLRQLFPSLTSLKIQQPSEDFLQGIWQMENLIELHLNLEKRPGSSECWGWRDNRDVKDFSEALFGNPHEDREVEESILNLKKLRYLSILKYRWNRDGNWIPEETVRNGFGKLRSLAVLKLPRSYIPIPESEFLWTHLPYLKELK